MGNFSEVEPGLGETNKAGPLLSRVPFKKTTTKPQQLGKKIMSEETIQIIE